MQFQGRVSMNVIDDLRFKQQHSIDFGLIDVLHRGQEHIPICVKDDNGELRDLFSIPACETSHIFPQVAHHLERDSFFSINSYWRPGRRRLNSYYSIRSCDGTQTPLFAPFGQRRKQYLQRINAIHCDLDCHSKGLSPGEVVGKLLDMQDVGKLPRVSYFMRSGRGVWAFWLIHDRLDATRGQEATWLAKEAADSLNRTVQQRLSHLGADRQAVDLYRICRIPGSVNSKSGGLVDCLPNVDSHGKVASYTLDELAGLFGIATERRSKPTHTSGKPVPDAIKGAQARWKKEVERFEKLWKHRHLFREGVRGAAVYLYHTFLKYHQRGNKGLSDEEIRRKMDSLFHSLERINPTGSTGTVISGKSRDYSLRDFERQLLTKSDAKPSHNLISELLKITPAESSLTGWPAVGETKKLTCADKRALRRRLIQMWFVEDGELQPTCRQLAERIGKHDPRLTCTFRTALSDYKAVMSSASINVVQLLG
jgi:hypothetical protein